MSNDIDVYVHLIFNIEKIAKGSKTRGRKKNNNNDNDEQQRHHFRDK